MIKKFKVFVVLGIIIFSLSLVGCTTYAGFNEVNNKGELVEFGTEEYVCFKHCEGLDYNFQSYFFKKSICICETKIQ